MTTWLKSALAAAAAVLILAAPALAAPTVEISSAQQDGTDVVVAGSAVFGDQSMVEVGTDAADDAEVLGGPAGGELTGASIATKENGRLLFQWRLAELPPTGSPLPFGTTYHWQFCVSSGGCWQLSAQGMGMGGLFDLAPRPQTDYFAMLVDCSDPQCAELGFTQIHDDLVATFDADAATITVEVPPNLIAAGAGKTITQTDGGFFPVFTAAGEWSLCCWQYSLGTPAGDIVTGDAIDEVTPYAVPAKSVSLALTPTGTEATDADFVGSTSLSGDGAFSGRIAAGDLAPGAYDVSARACFGAGNCTVATAPTTLG